MTHVQTRNELKAFSDITGDSNKKREYAYTLNQIMKFLSTNNQEEARDILSGKASL
jgi:hypothetical protein